MIDLTKSLLCYMTFSLSNDPSGNGRAAEELALKIMKRHPNLTVLIAHNSTQWMEKAEKYRSMFADICIIAAADLLILGKPLDYGDSCGSCWEFQIAKFHQKPIITSDFLIGFSPAPHLWREDRRAKKLEKYLAGT